MKYPDERREATLKKLLPPHNRTVSQVAEEEGISAATLYSWRKQALLKVACCRTMPTRLKAGARRTSFMPCWKRPR